MSTTTQLETVDVMVRKARVLRNQQPSSVQEKVQRPSRKGVGASAPKCPAPRVAGEDMVCSRRKRRAAKAVLSQRLSTNNKVTWDVFSDVATAGGVIVETNTMPETNFTITQGTLTITEAGNSVPYSGKLDNLSKFPVMELIQKVLKNDAVKTFDRLAWAQFNSTPLRVCSTDTGTGTLYLATNGTCTAINSAAYNYSHAKKVVDLMKERNLPAYLGDDWLMAA